MTMRIKNFFLDVLRGIYGWTPTHLESPLTGRICKIWLYLKPGCDKGIPGGTTHFDLPTKGVDIRVDFGQSDEVHTFTNERDAAKAIDAYLNGQKIEPGVFFEEHINQSSRECEVLSVNKGRGFRIAYEMPNAGEMQATRYGIRIKKGPWAGLYYRPEEEDLWMNF